jgi:hypothetical protein
MWLARPGSEANVYESQCSGVVLEMTVQGSENLIKEFFGLWSSEVL